ncbi:MAG: hypothetical protein VX938_10305, partial [Myxococcota bacterium]|nr:hypothetical protein [Myxococcota bacterium]
MKTRVLFWTTTAALMFFSGLASAAVPLELPVQGVLRDNAGLPVAEDVFEMTFALYDGPDAVAPVWTEARVPADGESCVTTPEACVHVTGGVFHVNLGSGEPLGLEILKANPGLWLGVTVETDPELPRRPLGSAPYARHAQDAASASSVNCSGCLEVEMLSDGARETLTQAALTAVEEAGFAKQADLVVGEGNLPGNGLNEVSNGLLSNEFVHTFSLEAPVDIKDDFPPGVSTSIVVPNVGIAQSLRVSIDITNSDLSTLSV